MTKVLERWEVAPHDPLVELDDGILTVTGDIHMPLGNFPRRMTVVRLAMGRTAIFSAMALDEAEMTRIEALGKLAVLIVPDAGHRLDSRIWKQRYPSLRVLTPPGSRADVESVVPVDAVADILEDPDVHFQVVAGTEEKDSALIVRRSSGHTIICNDIIGNVQHPKGLGAKIMSRLLNYGPGEPQIPRPAHHYIKDPQALALQLRAWAALPNLQRVVVSHGDVITTDPAGQLNRLADELALN